jgi:hypothetical protein
MIQTQSGIGKAGGILFAILSLVASGLLAVRYYRLRAEVIAQHDMLAWSRNRAALATLDSFSLPPNRKMAVCNHSGEVSAITALTAFYTDSHGKLQIFNSGSNQWHTWAISAGSNQKLNLAKDGATIWDGSVVFYAMDIGHSGGQQGKTQLLSGTSDDLVSGCISLPSQ